MMHNLYWNVYRGLERELLELANVIHIDDDQLEVYSTKIAELLIRTCVEIEAIAKEIYFREGGTKKEDGSNLYFDTDCLGLLESRWLLSKKIVAVSNPALYLTKEENLMLKPLYKADKRGSSSSDWKKAYQAVKHDRSNSLKKGNLKNFIRALSALFLLNIYYKDTKVSLESNIDSFDTGLGSQVFSVLVHRFSPVDSSGIWRKADFYDNSVYLVKATDQTGDKLVKSLKAINDDYWNRALKQVQNELSSNITSNLQSEEQIRLRLQEAYTKAKNSPNHELYAKHVEVAKLLQYEAVLNKQQY